MPQDQDDIKGTDAMKQAPTPDPLSKYANDKAAKALYDSWSSLNGWVPWVERGNSDMQEHARRLATRSEALSDLAALDGETMDFAPIAPVETAPGHTDLMVSPESIDAFLEANPPPVETLGETAWDDVDIEDLLSDAIGDSIDLGWSSRDGAKAALAALKKEGLLIFPTQPDTGKVEASGVEREPAAWAVAAEIATADAYAEYMGDPDGQDSTSAARLAAALAIETHALAALRPQPSGETRKALDRLKMAAHVYEDDEMAADCATLEALLSARPAPVASGGQHSSANDFPPGEVTDEWAERFCEAVNWSPDGQECKAVEGQVRCVSFRDLAKGYILSAIATQPAITSVTAPVAETAGEAHEARAIRLQAALDAAIAADDGLARAAAAEAQLDRLVDYLAGHLNGLRVGRKEAVDTVIVNLTKLIEAQATTPPVPAQDDDKLREEETEVQYEVWGAGPQGDFCAGADTLSDAQHYAVVYGQDGPVVIKVATTTRVVWAEASPALKSTAAQEGGEV